MSEHHVDREFDTPQPVGLAIDIAKGSVDVRLAETGTTRVRVEGRDADQVTIEQHGSEIRVIGPKPGLGFLSAGSSLRVSVEAPTRSDLAVRTGSADVAVAGPAGTASLRTGSGDVRVAALTGTSVIESGSGDVRVDDAAAALRVKSGSGEVSVQRAADTLAVSTGSGDVVVGTALATLAVKTGSGDLRLGESRGDVTMTTGSGDVAIMTAHRGRVTTKGASGDVRVGVPPAVPVWTDLSTVTGHIRSDLPGAGKPADGADYVELRATTVSGDIVLVPA